MAPQGNQTVSGENKHQPALSGETGLLDSIDMRGCDLYTPPALEQVLIMEQG